MKRITQTREIQSGDNSGVIISGAEKLSLSYPFELSEFELDDTITLRAAQELANQNDPSKILSPWFPGEEVGADEYRTHVVNGIEYLFRSLVDENISEPTLEGGSNAWTDLESNGDIFPQWNNSTSYPVGELVQFFNLNNVVYRSKSTEINHNPELDTSNIYWDIVGTDPVLFELGNTYSLNQIVLDEDDSYRRYVSNIAANEYPLDGQISGSWQVEGIIISDDEVSLTKTWSSQKISDAIASASGVSSKGSFSSTDTGQSVINIPHGLTGTPTWFGIQGTNVISTGVINKSDLTVDSNNIIITPEFMNNDGAVLNFLWKAEL